MKSDEIIEIFNNIDEALKKLGKSDSSIEYTPHIRQEFSNVLQQIDHLKYETGNGKLLKNWSWYFD